MKTACTLPRTMKAVLLTGHGGFDQLQYRDDVPVPVPAAGEVLIQIGAASINNTDINTRVGWYSKAVSDGTGDANSRAPSSDAGDSSWTGTGLAFPRIQGIDACGRIVAVGDGVAADRVGERVIVDPVIRSESGSVHDVGYLGSERDGSYAEYAAVPARNAWRIDSALTDTELASFPCAYQTAENLLCRAAVAAGETVLVTGASGGVGIAAVQLAGRRGASVVAVAGAAKLRAIEALGAVKAVPRDGDLVAELGPESVDAVIDVVGGRGFPALLEVLRRGGRYAVAGAIDGPIVPLDLRTLYLKDLRLLGCTVPDTGIFGNLVRYIERGEVRALIGASYPLCDIVAAQKDFLGKTRVGKIVLTPG